MHDGYCASWCRGHILAAAQLITRARAHATQCCALRAHGRRSARASFERSTMLRASSRCASLSSHTTCLLRGNGSRLYARRTLVCSSSSSHHTCQSQTYTHHQSYDLLFSLVSKHQTHIRSRPFKELSPTSPTTTPTTAAATATTSSPTVASQLTALYISLSTPRKTALPETKTLRGNKKRVMMRHTLTHVLARRDEESISQQKRQTCFHG